MLWKVLLAIPAIVVNQIALSVAMNWFAQGQASVTKWLVIAVLFLGALFFIYRVVKAQHGRSLLVLAGVGVAILVLIALALSVFAISTMGPLH